MDDGPEQGWFQSKWNNDKGIKDWPGTCDFNNGHMRVYARGNSDKNYNTDLGYYVIASNHIDRELASTSTCDRRYNGYESHEDWWVDRIEDHIGGSPYNWAMGGQKWMGNRVITATLISSSDESPQWYQSDGYAQKVWVSGQD